MWSQLSLQDSASPIMENLCMFYDHAMLIIILITSLIFYILMTLIINKFSNKLILHNQMIEIIWTISPMIILIFLTIPSLKILYLTDEILNPLMTIKIIGHQWFWSYEYSDFKNLKFDSYIYYPQFNLNNYFRLLDVDNRLIIPFNMNIRLLISSTDVIHSWTIPSIGVKIDSIPGRINQSPILINRPGIYFGQCSEICGTNHSFMPICLECTSYKLFLNWIKNLK